MLTHEERISRLEADMVERKRLRSREEQDRSDLGEIVRGQLKLIKAIAKTQSEHNQTLAKHTAMFEKVMATLDRHTAMHKEHGFALAGLTLDRHSSKERDEQIIGLLHTLADRGDGR